MQRWLKFQFQSRDLFGKLFFSLLAVIILVSINSESFGEVGQTIDISKYFEHEDFKSGTGTIIESDIIIFEIGKKADVHVKHIIQGDAWNASQPKLIKILPGSHSNFKVADEEGDPVNPNSFLGETFEESEYMIIGQKPHRGYDIVAEYDLEDFLELENGNLWKKDIRFDHDVQIFVDEEIDLIFVQSRPVDLSESKGINCIGCTMKLEFFNDTEPQIKIIKIFEKKLDEIIDTGEEYELEFLSDGKIGQVNFIEELNYMSFDVNKDQLVAISIPLDLLLSPYHVYLTGIDQDVLVEQNKIRKTEFSQTETHANVSFRPNIAGIIHVVGSMESEHEKLLSQLENRNTIDKNPPAETTQEQIVPQENQIDSFYDAWGEAPENSDDGNMIIFIIIGIIVVVIIGVIIKIKKN